MLEPVKVDKFKFVLEDLDNLHLAKSDKLGGNIEDLRKDSTLHVLFFLSTNLGLRFLGLALRRRCCGCSNPGL